MADMEFSRRARRPVPVVDGPLLQWASGLTTKDKRIYAGWMVEAGKLDVLDEAMEAAKFAQVTIKHGNGNIVTHWAVETANVFLIADGIQSMAEMKQTEDRYGVAFGWRTTEEGRQQSQLKARVLLRELLAVGYNDPLTLTVKSTLTSDVLNALMSQYSVLDAVDAFRAADEKPPMNPPLYACSLPLSAGAEVTRGRGSQTKEIVIPTANVPSPVDREYIKANWTRRSWTAIIEPLIDPTIAWSIVESQRFAAVEATYHPQVEESLL